MKWKIKEIEVDLATGRIRLWGKKEGEGWRCYTLARIDKKGELWLWAKSRAELVKGLGANFEKIVEKQSGKPL